MAHTQGKSKIRPVSNPFETINDVSDKLVHNRVAKSLGDDLVKEGSLTLVDQLLGLDHTAGKGEGKQKKEAAPLGVVEKVVFNLFDHLSAKGQDQQTQPEAPKPQARPEKPKPRIEAAMNYHAEIAKRSEKAAKGEMQQMNRDVQQIMVELKKLIASSNILKTEFAQFAVAETPREVGEYHKNFFEWMLIVVRQARQKVEQSGAWLQTVKGKNGKGKKGFAATDQTQHQSGERTTIQNSAG